MKTNFDELRKWRHYQVASAIVLLVLVVTDVISSVFFGFNRSSSRNICIVAFITSIMALKAVGHSRCPHCGMSVMSKWTGRDAAGRNCAKRIEERLPISCFHCGTEIVTD